MTATATTQDEATATAAEHGYHVEVHRQTTGDHWDVRLYWTSLDRWPPTGTDDKPCTYSRRRDTSKNQIGNRIMAMLAEFGL